MLREAFSKGPSAISGKSRPGFTFYEAIVTVVIFVLIATMTLTYLHWFQRGELQKTANQDLVQTIRRARHQALMGEQNSSWGIYIEPDAFTLYAGDMYSTRDSTYDEVHSVGTAVTFSGYLEFTFEQYTGRAIKAGTVIIEYPEKEDREIEVNTAGAIFPRIAS